MCRCIYTDIDQRAEGQIQTRELKVSQMETGEPRVRHRLESLGSDERKI